MVIPTIADHERDDDAPRRRVRRRPRASGRAVLGALLVTLAAVGAFAVARAGSAPPTTRYVVAARHLAPGERLQPADVELRTMDLPDDVRLQAFTDPGRLVGAVTLGPLGPNQLVQVPSVALGGAPGGLDGARHEVTFPVPRDRVPAALRRGERVAVLATFGSGNDARTVVSVPDAVVLAFDAEGDGIGGRGTARLTVALPDPATVLGTVHATQVAEVSVVRATLAEGALLAGTAISPPTTARTAAVGSGAPASTLAGGGLR